MTQAMRFRTALKASNSNKLMSCIGRAQAGRPRTIVLAASQPIHTFLPEYGVIVAKGFAPLAPPLVQAAGRATIYSLATATAANPVFASIRQLSLS